MTDFSQQSDEAMLTVQLRDLLNDISIQINEASDYKRERLLNFLKDWQACDRRRHPRKPSSIRVNYACATHDRTYTDCIKNVSVHGVFIHTSVPLSVGELVWVSFPFPDHEGPFRLTGETVWTSPLGVGVKFGSLSMRLREMVRSL